MDKEWSELEDKMLLLGRDSGMKYAEIIEGLPGRSWKAAQARHAYLKDPDRALSKRPLAPSRAPPIEPAIKLHDAMQDFYRKEAAKRGVSVEVIRLVLNYSPEELLVMHEALLAKANATNRVAGGAELA